MIMAHGPSRVIHGVLEVRTVRKCIQSNRVSSVHYKQVYYAGMIFARASMSAGPPAGGDSRVVSKYAVRKRSVARSSNEARTAAVGAAVCDGEFAALGSVVNFWVH